MEELVSASCRGRVDVEVRSAWAAVRDYIRNVAERAGLQVGYQFQRPKPCRAMLGDAEVDLSGYLDFSATGMCLKVKRRVDGEIIIGSSADCYFTPELEFTMAQVSPRVWQVRKVITVHQ